MQSQSSVMASLEDIENAEKIDKDEWCNRPAYKQLLERAARLFSHVL